MCYYIILEISITTQFFGVNTASMVPESFSLVDTFNKSKCFLLGLH